MKIIYTFYFEDPTVQHFIMDKLLFFVLIIGVIGISHGLMGKNQRDIHTFLKPNPPPAKALPWCYSDRDCPKDCYCPHGGGACKCPGQEVEDKSCDCPGGEDSVCSTDLDCGNRDCYCAYVFDTGLCTCP